MIDSHAHLTDERFTGEVAAVLARAREAGVESVVTIATRLEDSRAALQLARTHANLFATAGIHPHSAEEATDDAFREIREMAADPLVVAIGETGLDYYYDNAPRQVQRRCFERHLELAAELDLPVIVHAREADDDVRDILENAPRTVRGVLHCYSSGRALLDAGLALGWYVSFAGMVTFSKFDAHQMVRDVPLERLLVETDSPYLAPAPNRGRRNEPANVIHVLHRVAELRGESPEVLDAATTANTRTLYRLGG